MGHIGVDSGKIMSEWIKSDDVLPSEDGNYLTYKKNWKSLVIMTFDAKRKKFFYLSYRDPSHWMTLPEKPK